MPLIYFGILKFCSYLLPLVMLMFWNLFMLIFLYAPNLFWYSEILFLFASIGYVAVLEFVYVDFCIRPYDVNFFEGF